MASYARATARLRTISQTPPSPSRRPNFHPSLAQFRITKPSKYRPERGPLAKSPTSTRKQRNASRSLCRSRLKLWNRMVDDEEAQISKQKFSKKSLGPRLDVLGAMDEDGKLRRLPKQRISVAKSVEDMELERERVRVGSTPLRDSHSFNEDHGSSRHEDMLLAEEGKDGAAMGLIDYLFVEEMRQGDEIDVELLALGEYTLSEIEGCWRRLKNGIDVEISELGVRAWITHCEEQRAHKGALMDTRCRSIVQGVMAFSGRFN